MESILPILIGIVIILIGISNRKGNISLLHSYHRKRIQEEDKLPMGKLVGLGTIIIGLTIVIAEALPLIIQDFPETAISMMLAIGFIPGLGLNFYAIIKYNKGLF